MSHQPRVFITQRPRPNKNGWTPDFTPATKYGALHFIFESEDQPWRTPAQAMAHAEQVLRDFNPSHDYILWPQTGDPAAMWATLISLVMNEDITSIRFLYWERERSGDGTRTQGRGFYTPVTFTL